MKEQEMKHWSREGSKNKDIISSRKNDHRNFWFVGKNRDGNEEKKQENKDI